MIDYKITNTSNDPVGPLNLLEIFGRLCNAQPQIVTLQPAEEMEFCGEGEDISDIQERMDAALVGLGASRRDIAINHSFHVTPVQQVEVPPGPDLSEAVEPTINEV